jgi:hypothetical protein
VEAVATDFVKPNGLAFSPDEQFLYIADTGATHVKDGPRHIRRFAVASNGKTLSGGEVFAVCENGLFDGFRFDTNGNPMNLGGGRRPLLRARRHADLQDPDPGSRGKPLPWRLKAQPSPSTAFATARSMSLNVLEPTSKRTNQSGEKSSSVFPDDV